MTAKGQEVEAAAKEFDKAKEEADIAFAKEQKMLNKGIKAQETRTEKLNNQSLPLTPPEQAKMQNSNPEKDLSEKAYAVYCAERTIEKLTKKLAQIEGNLQLCKQEQSRLDLEKKNNGLTKG